MVLSPHVPRAVYGTSSVLLAWLLMQAVHEAGHVLAGLCVGDRVERVVLHPLEISRTDLFPGHNLPLTTAAGPFLGATVPLLLWGCCAVFHFPGRAWLRFFAGFCLIANGAYLGIAPLDPVGDAEVLLRHGAPLWSLFAFGVVTVCLGLGLWHKLGPEFGWGPNARQITARDAAIVVWALIGIVALESALSPRW